MTKWILSSLSVLLFVVILFINVGNNSEFNDEFNTNLSNVSNDEMEAVILENPDIHPMRMALANRYFDEVNYSEALPHYMYIAENSADSELKSFALAQIGWMVFESNNVEVATTYINESLKINSDSLVAKSYLGIIYIQDPETKADGIEILNSVIKSDKLSKDDKTFISEILENYESKFSILFIVLFFSLCSNSSDVNSDKIIISNLDLEPLLENVDVNELDTNFLIINYWASWCLECIEEHELLISLAETKKLEGKVAMVSFQDSRDNAIEFLNNYGYGQIIYAVDTQSKLAIDSGVFGVPETHIIVNGEIVKKFIGPLSLSNVEEIINNFP